MKVALVYDRVNKFGGAERVMLSLHHIFPDAPIYTLVYDTSSGSWAKKINIIPTFLNAIPWLRRRHELLAPLAPMAFETLDFSGYNVIISVTSSDAKAIITNPRQLHICYCLTPTRYFWSGEGEYKTDIKMKILPSFISNYFRTVDLLISTRPDQYIAISKEVKDRIKKYYNRDSTIVYPPIEDKFYSNKLLSRLDREYYLVVGRQVPYKKTNLVVAAFNKLNRKLFVVGEGSELNKLKSLARGNDKICFVGKVNDSDLINYYQRAKAVIFPQEEDFGLVPIESQACGTPVIAYGKGGALETIVAGKTGVFFNHQTTKSLLRAIEKFERTDFDPKTCQENARKFSEDKFKANMLQEVSVVWDKFQKSL